VKDAGPIQIYKIKKLKTKKKPALLLTIIAVGQQYIDS
jgi:hypothetical protein